MVSSPDLPATVKSGRALLSSGTAFEFSEGELVYLNVLPLPNPEIPQGPWLDAGCFRRPSGLNRAHVGEVERRDSNVTIQTLKIIADTLKVKIEDLVRGRQFNRKRRDELPAPFSLDINIH